MPYLAHSQIYYINSGCLCVRLSDTTILHFNSPAEPASAFSMVELVAVMTRRGAAFSMAEPACGFVVTSVCDGARVCHRRPTRPGPALPDFHQPGPPWGVPGRVRHRRPTGSRMISFHFNYPDSPKFQSND
jgi:hypothetical protein